MSGTNGKRNGKAKGKVPDPDTKDSAGVRDELGRIRPGHTLNREGGRRTHLVICRETLQQIIDAPVSEADKRSRLEAFWLNLFERSMKGDGVCSKILADRLLPATIKADLNVVGGMPAVQVVDIFALIGEDYVKAGRLQELTHGS